jgi:hypothetical protein
MSSLVIGNPGPGPYQSGNAARGPPPGRERRAALSARAVLGAAFRQPAPRLVSAMAAQDLRADDMTAAGAHPNKHVTPTVILGFRLVNSSLAIEVSNPVEAVVAQYPSHLLW